MTTVDPAAPASESGVIVGQDPAQHCAVCEHDLSDHDPISLRFCHATQAQALSRRCLCSVKPTAVHY